MNLPGDSADRAVVDAALDALCEDGVETVYREVQRLVAESQAGQIAESHRLESDLARNRIAPPKGCGRTTRCGCTPAESGGPTWARAARDFRCTSWRAAEVDEPGIRR